MRRKLSAYSLHLENEKFSYVYASEFSVNIVPECIFSTECMAENPLNYHFLQNARYLVLMG